jgi:hypothetical protein
MRWMLDHRGVDTPCKRCLGFGSIAYGSTATWRGGIGGCSVTRDVCDHCWGSGDEHEHWPDLRKLRNEERARVHAEAANLLSQRSGVGLSSLRPAIKSIALELHRLSRSRRLRPDGFGDVARSLASALEDMVKATEVRP